MATPTTNTGSDRSTTKPVWPHLLLAVLAIPAIYLVPVLSFGFYNPVSMLSWALWDTKAQLWIVFALVVGTPMFLLGVRGALVRSRENRQVRVARPAVPIGHTTDGKAIYPVVGYTSDGKPVTADRAVGVQSHSSGTNGLALASLITAFLIPVVPIILGHIARSQIRKTGQDGASLALWGLIIGYFSITANLVAVIVVVVAVTQGG